LQVGLHPASYLEKLKHCLVESFLAVFGQDLVSLVLFGSYARGNYTAESDIDLLVVLEDFEDRFEVHRLLDRVEELSSPCLEGLRSLGYSPVLSPVILSRSQASAIRPLYLDLVFDYEVLYDRGGFITSVLEGLKAKLREYRAERRFIGRRWVVVLKKDLRFGEVVEL
jgi:predicted nucleotidyltransferase